MRNLALEIACEERRNLSIRGEGFSVCSRCRNPLWDGRKLAYIVQTQQCRPQNAHVLIPGLNVREGMVRHSANIPHTNKRNLPLPTGGVDGIVPHDRLDVLRPQIILYLSSAAPLAQHTCRDETPPKRNREHEPINHEHLNTANSTPSLFARYSQTNPTSLFSPISTWLPHMSTNRLAPFATA